MNIEEIIKFWHSHSDLLTPILIGCYELIARVVPTKRNLSIIENAVKLLGVIVKNRRTPDPNDNASLDGAKNKVTVSRNKHIISCLLLLIVSVSASAQLTGTFRAVRFGSFNSSNQFVGADTTFLNLTPNQYPVGTVIREITTDTLFYKYPDGFWHKLVPPGGAGSVTASNGLTKVGDDIQLGGTLSDNTIISATGSGKNLTISLDESEYTYQGLSASIFSTVSNTIQAPISVLYGDTYLDLGSAEFRLNGSAAVSPSTQFFRGDGTWAPAGASPGGADTNVQFNDGGTFGGTDNFIYNQNTFELSLIDGLLTTVIEPERITATSTTNETLYTAAGINTEATGEISLSFGASGIGSIYQGATAVDNLTFDAADGIAAHPDAQDIIFESGSTTQAGESGAITIRTGTATGSATGSGALLIQGRSASPLSITTVSGAMNINSSSGAIAIGTGGGGDLTLGVNSAASTYLFITGLPTSCAGAPAGSIANVSGTLTVCP